MSVENFKNICDRYKFYHFNTPEDYSKWIKLL